STRARISSALKQASKQILTYGRYITLHKLRHLSAMKFLMENKNKDEGTRLLLLMHRMGHQQLSTTSNYLDFLPSAGLIYFHIQSHNTPSNCIMRSNRHL